ncbi:hypothetical protein ACFLU8_04260 [Chloroflexota bacterium]
MANWKFKGCPRCGGDMFLDKDMNNWYEQCLQCSYRHELKDIAEFQGQPFRGEMEPALVRRKQLRKRPNV